MNVVRNVPEQGAARGSDGGRTASLAPVRIRWLVILLAVVATVAIPAEVATEASVGSVVDQVSSCLQPNAVARDVAHEATGALVQAVPGPLTSLAIVVLAGLAGIGSGAIALGRRRRAERWQYVVPRAWAGSGLRAPPISV